MTTTKHEGRPVSQTAPASVARAADHGSPRCARCGLDRRRDAVGRRLASLAARVALLDVRGLALVAAAIEDAVEALDEEVNS